MASTTRAVSPGAALLRSSRLFSVPNPLPRPNVEVGSGKVFDSNTATLSHPTHQTIATPASSLNRGDWGLKRPLPLRATTRTSTPLIRINAMDSFEHITEFASAADHTLTLQKWQELNLPLTTPPIKESGFATGARLRSNGKGVFEADVDNVADRSERSADNRWKFEGPWLAGQTEGEFNNYVRTAVRQRKHEFMAFVRTTKAKIETNKANKLNKDAIESGQESPVSFTAADITEDQMRQYLRELRQDRRALFGLIRRFLDLPPAPTPVLGLDESFLDVFGSGSGRTNTQTIYAEEAQQKTNSPYAENGPPKTHPSAGLSYLRTANQVSNHPLYGPQAVPAPVQGRIIMPKNAAVGSFQPKLGVAGVVADVPAGQDSFNISNMRSSRKGAPRRETMPGLINIEPDKQGGSKVWLQPTTASINSKGTIQLQVVSANPDAVDIHEGKPVDRSTEARERSRAMPRIAPLPRPQGRSLGYGLGGGSFGPRDESRDGKATDDEAYGALNALLASASGRKS